MSDDGEHMSLAAKLADAFAIAASHPNECARALDMLSTVARMASAMSVISPNDRFDEISTPSLRMFLVLSLQAELEAAMQIDPSKDRMQQRKAHVEAASGAARMFFATVQRHQALPAPVVSVLRVAIGEDGKHKPLAPPDKRMFKIQTFKLEKTVRARLGAFRDAYRAKQAKTMKEAVIPSDVYYDVLSGASEGLDDDTEMEPVVTPSLEVPPVQTLRSYLTLLIVLHALRTAALLESVSQELELLTNVPPEEAMQTAPAEQAQRSDSTWRLDQTWSASSNAPLLSESGRPLRPFTIIPNQSKREQLKSEVFRPSHRLPTMSIDEYLAEEARRGNIVQGKGQTPDTATPREHRTERAEQDGTRDAEEAEEEARQEAIRWDAFKDAHRRGEGNRMNRG